MGNLVARYIASLNQPIDIFTKPLDKDTFQSFKSKLSVHAHARLRGHAKNKNLAYHAIDIFSQEVHIKLHPKRIKRNINIHKS